MANQSPDRREVLAMIALAATASRFPGFARWICAPEHAAGSVSETRPQTYAPQFFDAAEFAAIDQLCELIIPKGESPGARDAGVAEFIDFMVASDPKLQWPFRYGLDWLETRSMDLHGSGFTKLSDTEQEALLRTIAYRKTCEPTDGDGCAFFKLLRQYTVIGYYTSRIGMEELNNPGLRFYSESPACPHTGDPEHKHLPPPRF